MMLKKCKNDLRHFCEKVNFHILTSKMCKNESWYNMMFKKCKNDTWVNMISRKFKNESMSHCLHFFDIETRKNEKLFRMVSKVQKLHMKPRR